MGWAIVILFLAATVVVALKAKNSKPTNTEITLSYQCKDSLLTQTESKFLKDLDSSTDSGRYRIFSMVRVADVIQPSPSLDSSAWRKLFNKTTQKHFDFVLCDSSTLEPLCVIELNDKTHQQNKRKVRDEFLAQACESAGLPLYFVPVSSSYKTNIAEILSAFESPLKRAS